MSQRKIKIAELKEAILPSLDIAAFYSQYINFGNRPANIIADRSGWSHRLLCPIHGDKATPNFFVNMTTGSFKCHACNKSGSFVDFYMHMHHMEISDGKQVYEAIKKIADFARFDIEAYRNSGGDSEVARKHSEKSSPVKAITLEEDWEPKVNHANEHDRLNEPVNPELVKKWHSCLGPEHVMYLNQKRGLTKKTIEDWMIGFNPEARVKSADGAFHSGRYAIPVLNIVRQCRNIRLYSSKAEPAVKMINLVIDKDTQTEKRYGSPPRLFGVHLLYNNPIIQNVVVVEGEWDCMLLNQMLQECGYDSWAAVTSTHGAGKFQREWITYMFGKNVYFALDCDEAGKLAANDAIADHFIKPMQKNKFSSVRNVLLPLPGTKESKDVSDYLLRSGFNIHDFVKLCGDSPELIVGGVECDEATVDSIQVSDFIAAIKNRNYIDKRITVPLTIAGCSDRTYHAIRTFKVSSCEFFGKDCCMGDDEKSCPEKHVPYGHSIFIESCMEREGNILRSIGRIACKKADNIPSIRPIKKVVMEKYMAHQVVKRWRAEENEEGRLQNTQELTQAPIYVLQPPERINIEPQSYMATGWIRTDPKTCAATFFVEKMVPMEKDWKRFTMKNSENYELISAIKQFNTKELKDQIVNGVTKIYNSDEILYGVLLVFLSPIQFAFNGTLLRGWINAAIIGDSGTGKSQTYMRFSDWIETGDLFSALTGTRTGLLYSIKTKGGEWFVSIGRYVQASDTIIAVDESQEIAGEEIKQMAFAMDIGYLKVDRVASGGYHTRTRTLFLMNPKDKNGHAATVSDFANGCEALMMCFPPMFIRRLDFAIFTTGGKDYEVYNKRNISAGKVEMTLTAKMMRALVYWAWTRTAAQIHWTDEAMDECLKSATEMSLIYGDADKIPLVNPQDFRENLARISVAFAILDRNFTPDLEGVTVEPKHVRFVTKYLNMLYSSPACNLKQFSKFCKSRSAIDDYDTVKETIDKIIEQEKFANSVYVRECMPFIQMIAVIQQLNGVQSQQLSDQLNMPRPWVNRRLATLQALNLIEVIRSGFRGTRRFNLFMRKWQADPEVEKLFDKARNAIGKFQSGPVDDIPDYTSSFKPLPPGGDPFK